MNLPRAEVRRSNLVSQGINQALGDKTPEAWFEATSDDAASGKAAYERDVALSAMDAAADARRAG
jgi:hypothetical protein